MRCGVDHGRGSLQARADVRLQQEGRMAAVGAAVPAARLIPPYKSWAFLAKNERAVQTGLRMFYLDDTGGRRTECAILWYIPIFHWR